MHQMLLGEGYSDLVAPSHLVVLSCTFPSYVPRVAPALACELDGAFRNAVISVAPALRTFSGCFFLTWIPSVALIKTQGRPTGPSTLADGVTLLSYSLAELNESPPPTHQTLGRSYLDIKSIVASTS